MTASNNMENREKLLQSWIYKVIADNPNFIDTKIGIIGLYGNLQDEFLKDAQLVMKAFSQEVIASKK